MKNSEVSDMKIQGPNPYLNVYKANQPTIKSPKGEGTKDDQLNISSKALQLQKNEMKASRKQEIADIKALVQSGDYKINYGKTAEKLLEFWRS